MTDRPVPKIAKWPFLLGDVALLIIAAFFVYQTDVKFDLRLILTMAACVAAGAFLCVTPYIMEYKAAAKLAEADGIASIVDQVQNLEQLTQQINAAGAKLQETEEHSSKSIAAAKQIADRMTAEAQAFNEFMQKSSDAERATLRLEVEKLRRAESEWLQVVVRMLDHTFAIHQAASRSGQRNVADQLGQFQLACRDAARRLGVVPFTPNPGDAFDAKAHQPVDANAKPAENDTVIGVIAPGYTFQGQLVRPAAVVLQSMQPPAAPQPTAEALTIASEEPRLL